MLGEDPAGRLWVGTGRGVHVLAAGARTVERTFTVADGLPSDDCDSQAFLAEPGGDVWIGTSSGLGRFVGRRDLGPAPPPATLFVSLRAGRRDLARALDEVALAHDENSLEYHLAAPSFVSESFVERQVLLAGLEAEWHDAVDVRGRFAALPPGSYTLRARARYPGGAWGPEARLAFTVVPPWWQRWWARALAGLALAGLPALAVNLRRRAALRRNRELEALVGERTRELREAQDLLVRLEKQATEQHMAGGFAHEMRNVLAAARLLLARLKGAGGAIEGSVFARNSDLLRELFLAIRDRLDPEARRGAAVLLKEVNAHEALADEALRGVDDALRRALLVTGRILEYARLGHEGPGHDPVSIPDAVRALLDPLRDDLAARGIEVALDLPDGLTWTGEAAHLDSILENLVLNARDALELVPESAPRRLTIAAADEGGQIALRVEDSGPGIAPEHMDRIFDPFFSTKPISGTGLGLGEVRKLVELYGGAVGVRSEIGRGATFTCTLPAGTSERGP